MKQINDYFEKINHKLKSATLPEDYVIEHGRLSRWIGELTKRYSAPAIEKGIKTHLDIHFLLKIRKCDDHLQYYNTLYFIRRQLQEIAQKLIAESQKSESPSASLSSSNQFFSSNVVTSTSVNVTTSSSENSSAPFYKIYSRI